MITDWIIDIFQAALIALLYLLPPLDLGDSPSLDVLAAANIVFPISEFVTIFGLLVTYATVSLTWMIIWRIYHAIRG